MNNTPSQTPKTLIIWDYNGTLINDGDIWARASQNFYKELNLNFTSRQIREAYDTPISKMIYTLTGSSLEEFDDTLLQNAKDAFRETVDHYTPFVKPRGGIPDILYEFQQTGFRQIVASNHQQDLLTAEIEQAGIEAYFDLISGRKGEDEIFQKTTKGNRIITCVGKLEQLTEQRFKHIFLIGDSPEEARLRDEIKQSGLLIRSIGFNGGFSTPEVMEKAGHDAIINNANELPEKIRVLSC